EADAHGVAEWLVGRIACRALQLLPSRSRGVGDHTGLRIAELDADGPRRHRRLFDRVRAHDDALPPENAAAHRGTIDVDVCLARSPASQHEPAAGSRLHDARLERDDVTYVIDRQLRHI